MKEQGQWLYVHVLGDTKRMFQGTQEMCEQFLRERFLWEQYELGAVLISEWFAERKAESIDPPDPYGELPPEHFLD